ncbi:hypothetical protein ACSQ6I_01295 [Anabaena sp. WFMT]|uniref:hypothetical protein n=1 Tax=Anabaena sp. WFMT TaxID=3449730 RepID=UPI003F275D10
MANATLRERLGGRLALSFDKSYSELAELLNYRVVEGDQGEKEFLDSCTNNLYRK